MKKIICAILENTMQLRQSTYNLGVEEYNKRLKELKELKEWKEWEQSKRLEINIEGEACIFLYKGCDFEIVSRIRNLVMYCRDIMRDTNELDYVNTGEENTRPQRVREWYEISNYIAFHDGDFADIADTEKKVYKIRLRDLVHLPKIGNLYGSMDEAMKLFEVMLDAELNTMNCIDNRVKFILNVLSQYKDSAYGCKDGFRKKLKAVTVTTLPIRRNASRRDVIVFSENETHTDQVYNFEIGMRLRSLSFDDKESSVDQKDGLMQILLDQVFNMLNVFVMHCSWNGCYLREYEFIKDKSKEQITSMEYCLQLLMEMNETKEERLERVEEEIFMHVNREMFNGM